MAQKKTFRHHGKAKLHHLRYIIEDQKPITMENFPVTLMERATQ